MSRNISTGQRDGNWGAIHARLAAEDAERMARLNEACRREPPTCQHCGAEVQGRPGTRGYCWRAPCQRERRRVEYQRARARGLSAEDARS